MPLIRIPLIEMPSIRMPLIKIAIGWLNYKWVQISFICIISSSNVRTFGNGTTVFDRWSFDQMLLHQPLKK
jgi:hypothetical protein